MRAIVLAVCLLSAGPAGASNERADRNMAAARAAAYRRAVLNYQWQRQFNVLRHRQHSSPPAQPPALDADRQSRRFWQQWFRPEPSSPLYSRSPYSPIYPHSRWRPTPGPFVKRRQ